MKKIISIFLAFILSASLLVACGGETVEETPAPAAPDAAVEETPAAGVGEYQFSESCIEGLDKYEIGYTVTLLEDGGFAITAANALTGETLTYEGDSYEWSETYFTTGAAEGENLPAWFNPDGSCLWVVAGTNATCPLWTSA